MNEKKKNRRIVLSLLLAAAAVAAVVGAGSWWAKRDASPEQENRAVFAVRRGPLVISVTEAATIQSREKVVVRSQVEGRMTIVSLVDEGLRIEAGDLLMQLDASDFEQTHIEQSIRVQNGEAGLIQARETLAIVRNQGEADIEKGTLDLKFAQLDLEKYRQGEYPMELQQAQTKITLAKEELNKAEDQCDWSKKLAEEGYITRSELLADELNLKRKTIEVQTAEENLKLLETYKHGRDLAKLESDVKQAEMALERTRRKSKADVVKSEADLRAKDSEFQQQKGKLDKVQRQIDNCRITAPAGGMVVYAATGRGRWRSSEQPLEVGQQVAERQELFYLPTTSAMNVEINVQEASLRKVTEGLPVLVRVDAVPGEVFHGRLTKIAMMPDASMSWLNPDLKVYKCEAELSDGNEKLRPGMSCRAEIVVQELEAALYVPIQAVISVEGKPSVYVMGSGRPQPRAVELGMDNNRMVHVLSGLEPDEDVWLTPPLDKGQRPEGRRGGRDQKSPAEGAGEPAVSGAGQGERGERSPAQVGGESGGGPRRGEKGADTPRKPRGAPGSGRPGARPSPSGAQPAAQPAAGQ